MNLSDKNLAVIGAGNIGQILLERLPSGSFAKRGRAATHALRLKG
jgi:phosphoglycerate dehydrogenase-like enzyme